MAAWIFWRSRQSCVIVWLSPDRAYVARYRSAPRKFRTLPHISGCDRTPRWRSSVRLLRIQARTDQSVRNASLVEADRNRPIGPGWHFLGTAIEGIRRLGPAARPAVSALLKALADSHPRVRFAAVVALVAVLPAGDARRREAVPSLRRLLADQPQTLAGGLATGAVEVTVPRPVRRRRVLAD
jgi:hypothetical protein